VCRTDPLAAYSAAMAYDEDLADRVRGAITATHDVTEQKMFGGLAFLIGGHLAVAASLPPKPAKPARKQRQGAFAPLRGPGARAEWVGRLR
jgi:hypothetical protein